MSIQIVAGPHVNASYKSPELREAKVLVTGGQWRASATVRVTNEQGKKWRIGFVQVLQRNEVRATYEQHFVDEVRLDGQSFPILDGPKNPASRPFYDEGPPDVFDVEIPADAPAGTYRDVAIQLSDEPSTPFEWYLHGSDDPLQEVHCSFKFSIYVVAHDRTPGAPPATFLFLNQTNVKLRRGFRFHEVPRPKDGPIHGVNSRCEVEEPGAQPTVRNRGLNIKRPNDSLLLGIVANKGIGHLDTPRAFIPRVPVPASTSADDDWW